MAGRLKRILAVSYRMPPMLSPRSVQVHRLLSHWAGQGHEVHVLYATPETAAWPEWDAGLAGVYPDCLHMHPVPSPEQGQRRTFAKWFPKGSRLREPALKAWLPFLGLPDPQRWWVGRAVRAAQEVLRRVKIDAVVSFGNPMSDHLVGLRIQRISRLPWTAHFSDPWVDNPYGRLRGLSRTINVRQERQVVRHADRVVFVSEETRALILRKYPRAWQEKARVVPHYFDPALYPAPAAREKKAIFRHLGTFYGLRTPEPLLRALSLLHRNDPGVLSEARFELVGPCYPPTLVEDCLTGVDLPDCVSARPAVPYLESLRLMADSDVLISMDAPVGEVNVFLPSKLVDYLGAGRPLLGITPRGASADLIRRAGGLVADPRDVEGIAEAVRTYLNEFRAGTLSGRAPGEAVRSAYAVETVARRFEAVIEESLTHRGGR